MESLSRRPPQPGSRPARGSLLCPPADGRGRSGRRSGGVLEQSVLEAGIKPIVGTDGTPDITSAWNLTGRAAHVAAVIGVAVCVVVTSVWFPSAPAVVATGLALLPLIGAALVDAVEHRLPNALVGAAALPVAVAAALALAAGSTGIAAGALAGAGLLGGPLLVTHLVTPAGMGFGDVKAGAALGAAVGLVSAQLAVLTLMMALAGSAGWAVTGRRRHVALGPGLVAGALLSLAVGHLIGLEAN